MESELHAADVLGYFASDALVSTALVSSAVLVSLVTVLSLVAQIVRGLFFRRTKNSALARYEAVLEERLSDTLSQSMLTELRSKGADCSDVEVRSVVASAVRTSIQQAHRTAVAA